MNDNQIIIEEELGIQWYEECNVSWENYQLPGGENYQELKLVFKNAPVPYEETVHWPNNKGVLVWVRFNTRFTKDGKKVLFIEEIQSDWHQKGNARGYEPIKNIQGSKTDRQEEARLIVDRIIKDIGLEYPPHPKEMDKIDQEFKDTITEHVRKHWGEDKATSFKFSISKRFNR